MIEHADDAAARIATLAQLGARHTTTPESAWFAIVEPGTDDRFQEPDLWWPEDRRWFVATDTDLDWTVIGGSHELVAEVLTTFGGRAELVDRDVRNDQVS